ncbi:MAG: Ca-activated chloride channel family protein [Halioglobus sp.]|jgi:Ca-activated chloride channel family protein
MLPDLASLEHFHFLRPLWALVFVPYFLLWLVMRRRRVMGDMFDGIIAPHLLEHLRVNRSKSQWFNPQTFTGIMLVLFFLILTGPSWRQQESPLSQDEAALVILLDVSATMSQRDVQPSRLKRAKQKIGDLLELRPDKRAALIVYSGTAHTVLSLTADQSVLNQYLAAIEPGIMPRPGKFPEYSLVEVDKVLNQSHSAATLVLFGDGVGSETQEAFTRYFDTSQNQLMIMGIGTQSRSEGLIPLEQRALEDLAATSGGSYIEMTVNDRDVNRINRRIDSHFVVNQDSALPWLDSGYPLVLPAMALFLMWFRRGWTLTWVWIMMPLILVPPSYPAYAQELSEPQKTDMPENHWFADLWLTPDQQGRILLQRGEYAEAAQRFQDLSWKAIGHYYSEEFMIAAEYFSRTDSDDALFNEAVSRAQGRDYVRARNRYDRLLARSPDYPGAQSNRDRLQELIDEINRLSESQQAEAGVSSEDKELGGDEAIPADGADELSFEKSQLAQLSAEDILQDPATSEMWLRGVQQNPADFLAVKFDMQLQAREENQQPAKGKVQ